jgi:thiamine pyrophosphate-dependent acetolactate synthase large subunit-like protein
VRWPDFSKTLVRARPQGEPALIEEALKLLEAAKKPVVLSGSGVLWSDAAPELQKWVLETGMPIFTTPQGRGIIPEDHPQAFLNARSTAMKEADLLLVVGTRINYVFGHLKPPRVSKDAKIIRIDIDPTEISSNHRSDVGIVGDAKAVLQQMLNAANGRIKAGRYADWMGNLSSIEAQKRPESEKAMSTSNVPIHPLRLCEEVKNFMKRDAILVVDGQEILNYGRQSMPTFAPAHRLNSGPFGMMGVGLPFGLGAKVACPDKQVIVVHGDGSFGLNAMELDTAVRHKIPVLVVISLNGGWTADPKKEKTGRDLGFTRYDKMAESLGCYGEYVEKPEDIGAALARAQKKVDDGMVAVVNVKTDENARATTVRFSSHST